MKIKLSHVTKKYDTLTAVSDLSVNIEDGSLVSILGASGCGKTTILNMIAGLIEPTEGKILFDGQDSKTIDVTDRNIGMVFQDYALYPHMTVENNIAFPLKMKKLSKQSRKNRIQEIAELLNIYDLLNRYPKQLSGGQQQRVAIARALVKNPTVLLLDEPLSNLDRRLRIFLRDEIRTLQKRLGITTIFVTHDQEEAMAISDKILLMKDGCLLQYDTPYHLYHHPTHLYTCKFLSNPMLNLFSGVYENGKYFVELKNHTILLNPGKINHQAKKVPT